MVAQKYAARQGVGVDSPTWPRGCGNQRVLCANEMHNNSQLQKLWWHTPVTPALRGLRQRDHKLGPAWATELGFISTEK